jgi:hypothetical protein
MAPQRVAVFPMLQLQFGPGSIPSASTSATSVVTTDVVVGAATAAAGAGGGDAAGAVTGVVTGVAAAAAVGGGTVTSVVATGTVAVRVRVVGATAGFGTTGRAGAGPRVCFVAMVKVGGPEARAAPARTGVGRNEEMRLMVRSVATTTADGTMRIRPRLPRSRPLPKSTMC